MAKILSLFDGISCGRIALDRAGIKVDRYVSYEIDKNAIKVSKDNYPDIEQKGDVFQGDFTQYKGFDLLIGGSPCTYWSISKRDRETTADGMGYLLFSQYVRALKESQCPYFLYENNARIHQDIQDIISKELGVKPILIPSALLSAQNRNRLYWTNAPSIELPADKGIVLEDILTEADLAHYGGAAFTQLKQEPVTRIISTFKIGHTGSKDNQSTRVYSIKGKSQTIAAEAGGGGAKTGLYLWKDGKVYSLNASAAEKLQTLPAGYLKAITKDKGVKAAGNGWTVDVIAYILSYFKGLLADVITPPVASGNSCALSPDNDEETPIKPYGSTTESKAAFVAEVLSPLLIQANTGWSGAEYESTAAGEYVYLLNKFGTRSRKVDVTADSLQTLIADTFKAL